MSNFKQISKKLLSLTLALVMCLGFLPATARAADKSDTQISNDSYVKLQKTAQYDPDKKSYSIDLEAFVLGEVETTTTPLDIVLVVDQSGSMYRNDAGDRNTTNDADRRITKLKAALNEFANQIYQSAVDTGADHRIAIVGFACSKEDRSVSDAPNPAPAGKNPDGTLIYSSDYYYQDTGLFVDGYFKNYGVKGSNGSPVYLSDEDYQKSIVSVVDGSDTPQITESITTAISNISARGNTCALYGLLMAENIFRAAGSGREDAQKIVIVFSDGELCDGRPEQPGGYGANLNLIKSKASDLKKDGVTLYSVGFSKQPAFLKDVASDPVDKYYFEASNKEELFQAFQNISVDALNLPVKATRTTVLSDTLSPQFRFPEGFAPAKQLTLKAVPVAETGSETYSWNTDGAVALTSSDGTTFTGKLGEEEVACTVTVNIQDKTVEVTGFDYSSNAHCVRKQDGKWQGWKLVMGFPIEPDTNCKAWNGNGSFPTNNGAQLSGCETQNGDEVIKKTVTIPNPSAPVDTHTIKYAWGNGLKTENVTTKLPTPSQTAYIDGQSEAVSGAVKPGDIIETTDGALYRFDYWTVNGEKFEGPIEINGEDVTLTAKLTQVYSVTYTGKDAASGEPPVDEKSPYKEGDTVAVRPDSGSLVRTGYTFTGWKARENAVTPADGKFTMPACHIVFDPQWTINRHTLKVEYSYVGDEGTGPELPESYTKTLDFGTEYTADVPSFGGYTAAVTGDPVKGTVPDKDLQVFVTYTRNDTTVERSYTVKYFFDGVEDTVRSKTYTVHVWAGDASGKVPLQADVDTSLQPGYGTPAVTTGDNVPYAGELTRGTLFNDGEVITVSYVRDDEKVKETYYTVEHIVDEQVRDKATVHSSDWLLAETPMASIKDTTASTKA